MANLDLNARTARLRNDLNTDMARLSSKLKRLSEDVESNRSLAEGKDRTTAVRRFRTSMEDLDAFVKSTDMIRLRENFTLWVELSSYEDVVETNEQMWDRIEAASE